MWIIIPMFGSPLMTVLTVLAWYSISVLFGGPAFDAEKIGAILAGWAVLITIGFWCMIAWAESR